MQSGHWDDPLSARAESLRPFGRGQRSDVHDLDNGHLEIPASLTSDTHSFERRFVFGEIAWSQRAFSDPASGVILFTRGVVSVFEAEIFGVPFGIVSHLGNSSPDDGQAAIICVGTIPSRARSLSSGQNSQHPLVRIGASSPY